MEILIPDTLIANKSRKYLSLASLSIFCKLFLVQILPVSLSNVSQRKSVRLGCDRGTASG